jgi:hypothetical protein
MFVKVFTHTTDETSGSESLYECYHVHVFENAKNSDLIQIDMMGPGANHQTILVSQDGSREVYVMNEYGKTIDSYRWNPKTKRLNRGGD